MLPAFQIRGFRNHEEEGQDGDLADVRLDKREQYDELIVEHPVATLGYVDDDDGEVITVGSSMELYDRIDELQSLRPIVFDLLTSLRSWPQASNTAEGVRVWAEFVNRKYKGKEPVRPQNDETARSGILVDVSIPKAKVEEKKEEQKPLLAAFEEELEKLIEQSNKEKSQAEAANPASARRIVPTLSAAAPISPADIVSQAIQSISWASQSILRLHQDLPQRAQPAVENLSQAVHSAMGALTMQLSQVAQDAADRAQRAANATRDVDTTEIEAIKEKIRNLAIGIGHVAAQNAQAVGRDVGHGLGEGLGVVASEARKVAGNAKKEADKAGKAVKNAKKEATEEIQRGVREALGLLSKSDFTAKPSEFDTSEKEVVSDEKPQMAATEAEDREPYERPTSSNPGVEFVHASRYKSCADWLEDVKNKNAKQYRSTDAQSTHSKEQESLAFWQQMDRIAHYTTEHGGPSNIEPTAEEPKVSSEKEAEESDVYTASFSDDENCRARDELERSGRFGLKPRGRSSMHNLGRFRDDAGVEQRRKHHGSRRHHGPSHPILGDPRGSQFPRHHPRGPRSPPHPPHFLPAPGSPYSSHDRGHSFPYPLPPPPGPPHLPLSSCAYDSYLASPCGFPPPPPPQAASRYDESKYPPPPPPPSHPHTSFRRFGSDSDDGLRNSSGLSSSSHDDFKVGQCSRSKASRSLRRSRTVIGSTYVPPPAPFQRPIDLSRSISPAPAMPPIPTSIWRNSFSAMPSASGYTSPSIYIRGQGSSHRFENNRNDPAVKVTTSTHEDAVNADPFATPPRAPSPQPDLEPEAPAPDRFEDGIPESAAGGFYAAALPSVEPVSMALPFVPPAAPTAPPQLPQMAEIPTAFPSFLNARRSSHFATPVVDTNPFTAAVRNQARMSLPGTFPSGDDVEHSMPQVKNVHQESIDRCVAHLLEMGYGLRSGGPQSHTEDGDEVERLRVYAQITGGDLDAAIEMLEEEKRAWEGRV